MPNLEDLSSQALRDFVGNRALGNALVAEGANSATIKTTNAISYQINGELFTKAATDNIPMTACATQANGTTCYYLISIAAGGAITTTKGVDNEALIPECPVSQAPLAVLKVVASAAFTSGTTDLGTQDTFAQLAVLPAGRSPAGLTFA
jgi:hypothetical protein